MVAASCANLASELWNARESAEALPQPIAETVRIAMEPTRT